MDTAPICLCLALSNLEHAYYIQHSSFEAKNPGRGEAESISSKGRGWWKGGAGANAATDLRIPDSFKPPPTPTLRQEGTPPPPPPRGPYHSCGLGFRILHDLSDGFPDVL